MIDPLTNETVGVGLVIERVRQPSAPLASAEAVPEGAVRPATATAGRAPGRMPVTIWMTGLSGSGKSTLAARLKQQLAAQGRAAYILDGDVLREGLCRDLGFSAADRAENVRRAAETARLLNDAGLEVIVALISPFRADRAKAAAIIGAARFIEVFVDAPLAVCEARDPKGLYSKARKAQVAEFTGISSPYEPPAQPHVHLETAQTSPEAAVDQVLDYLRTHAGSQPNRHGATEDPTHHAG